MEKKPKDLWIRNTKYQEHVIIDSNTKLEMTDREIVFMKDIEKRKEAYGICGECNEPGTGYDWCQPCNAKRFKENFKNWTSGNKNIDEFIQHSQLNAVYYEKCLEWVPFEKFENVTYITKGGFGKIYSAEWPDGHIDSWNIEYQQWSRVLYTKVALKSLDNSSDISAGFLNEIKSILQIYLYDVIKCYGITQHPDTKDYMMILEYYEDGDLRNYLNKSENYISYESKIEKLFQIVRGLLDIHNAEKVHKDFHSGNILPYVAPEVLRGFQYTKKSDIYSFGIIMNEFMSEEMPYNDVPHDQILTVRICNGLRPQISEDTPKLIADLIIKCWDAKSENRPTAKELLQIFKEWHEKDINDENSLIYSQVKECEKIRVNKLKNRSNEDKSKDTIQIQTHSQAIYTSRLLNFKDLPEPVNSLDSLDLSSYL